MTTEERQKEIDDELDSLWAEPSLFKKIKNSIDWRLRKTKRLFRLVRAFWSTGYFDHTHIYEHIEYCLEEMLIEFERHRAAGWEHTTYKKDTQRMRVCKNLAERLVKSNYRSKYQDRADAQWKRREEACEDPEDFIKQFDTKDPLGEPNWSFKCIQEEEKMAKADKELLFELLNKHINRFWI